MGWWTSCEKRIIGDEPADILGEALAEIGKAYVKGQKRMPTVEEVKDLWQFVYAAYVKRRKKDNDNQTDMFEE